ncbi:DoxX family protein [Halorhabdus utahensis DSM 12940]|uniref:DoxX family protein n=2 Tax=Halorhabdus utahensis TaxID=146826 RepID=C7NN17_HALUD|nr:DoxX family protein [Halorhabdus utahensis DSM 12940]
MELAVYVPFEALRMTTRELDAELFGRAVSFRYSETWIGYSLLSLRLIMGWTFFYAGITKVLNPEWSVRGFLTYSIGPENPLSNLAGYNIWDIMATGEILGTGLYWYQLLTPLNQLGLTLVGLALIAGAFVRFSAFWGALMMTFYWLAAFPLEGSVLIDFHFVYVLLLFGIGAFGTGRILGLDAIIEEHPVTKPYLDRYPWLNLFLG